MEKTKFAIDFLAASSLKAIREAKNGMALPALILPSIKRSALLKLGVRAEARPSMTAARISSTFKCKMKR